jgi:hypothetical protein
MEFGDVEMELALSNITIPEIMQVISTVIHVTPVLRAPWYFPFSVLLGLFSVALIQPT